MPAKDKTSRFTAKSGQAMGDGVNSEATACFEVRTCHEKDLAAASERFAAVLRRVPVAETIKTGLRNNRHVRFSDDGRLLWTTTFESDWHRYIGRTATRTRSTQPANDRNRRTPARARSQNVPLISRECRST